MNKKLMMTLLIGVMSLVLINAAIMAYFGQIKTTVDVEQPISFFVNEVEQTGQQVSEDVPCDAGETCMSLNAYRIVNDGDTDRTLSLITSGNTNGVDVKYYELAEYSLGGVYNIDGSIAPLLVTVEEDGEWMVWTFDFPVEEFTGDGNLNVGLIIATNGEDQGPAFQIHNDDGADADFTDGTWLYSEWGPTIEDGWYGWHTGTGGNNILVSEIDWVEASGDRKGQGTNGILQVKILKSELGESFHWAASPTVGSGFYAPVYDVAMQIPDAFSWSTPIVDMTVPNYVYAEKTMEELTSPFTIPAGDSVEFYPQFSVDDMATEGKYIIYTTVNLVE